MRSPGRYAVRPHSVPIPRVPDPTRSPARLELPVTVLMERHVVARRFWSSPSWRLAGVVAGGDVVHEAREGRRLRELPDGGEVWSWSGHAVRLHRDACERYWHALIGDRPLVYVVCRESSGDAPLRPLVVTVDYDAATAFAETDDLVLSAPIPGDLYRYMEAFVLEHYRPRPFRKRERRNWSAEGADGPARDPGAGPDAGPDGGAAGPGRGPR